MAETIHRPRRRRGHDSTPSFLHKLSDGTTYPGCIDEQKTGHIMHQRLLSPRPTATARFHALAARYRTIAACLLLACAALSAPAQDRRGVYTDDSVVARDALLRVRELHDAGNAAEALRVLQNLLENDGDKVLARNALDPAADGDLFIPVRRHVHDLLRRYPDLLAAYIGQQEPRAARLLEQGEGALVEQTLFLTPSGFEATLRQAQLELEAGRFESARLILTPLIDHPAALAGSAPASEAARLASLIAAYIPRDEVAAWAKTWADLARLAPDELTLPVPAAPALALARGRTPLDSWSRSPQTGGPQRPLRSTPLDPATVNLPQATPAITIPGRSNSNSTAWIFPAVVGGVVFAADGHSIGAWDAATLAPIWRTRLATGGAFSWSGDEALAIAMSGGRSELEDVSAVAVSGGVCVTATGLPNNGQRTGDRRVHAVDAATGAVLWSVDPGWLDQRRQGTRDGPPAVVQGPPVIDADTVIVGLKRPGQSRRITSLSLVGLDLYTGNLRYARTVGSYGTNPWGRTFSRPEGTIVHHGVVYRADDMGVLGAYEAATGRPLWVRLSATPTTGGFNFRSDDGRPPYAMHTPVAVGEVLFTIEQGTGRVVKLSAADGALLAARDASAMATPWYLVRVGDSLAGVGDSRVACVRIDEFETGSARLSPTMSRPPIVGRAFAAAGRLYVPTGEGIVSMNPAQPDDPVTMLLGASGNFIAALSVEGAEPHLISADRAWLHTYVPWDNARTLLEQRVASNPNDASPLLTYIDLVHRMGRPDSVPALADQALAVLDRNAASPAAATQRDALFTQLIEIVTKSRRAWEHAAPAANETARAAQHEPAPVRDLGTLDEIIQRLSRAAETPAQEVGVVFELAWLRTVQGRPADAADALQRVLLSEQLAAVVLENDFTNPRTDLALPSATSTAAERATATLTSIILASGAAAYAVFENEAQRMFDALGPAPSAEQLESLARRYPCAGITPRLWLSAAELHARADATTQARLALGASIRAAELNERIGRPGQHEVLGLAAGRLHDILADRPNDVEPLYRLLARLTDSREGLTIQTRAGSLSAASAMSALRDALARRSQPARIGPTPSTDSVQTLAGWDPLPSSLTPTAPGAAYGGLVMISETARQIALWNTSAEDGRLAQAWSRPYQVRPTLVRHTPDVSYLYWPAPGGGVVEAIANSGGPARVGSTLWKSESFSSYFSDPADIAGGVRFMTPIDGQVRGEDVILAADDRVICILQRSGRAVALLQRDGSPAWPSQTVVQRDFEMELAHGSLVIAGATRLAPGQDRWRGVVVALSLTDGSPSSTLSHEELGDHPRWVRADPSGGAIVGTSDGLLRYNPADGQVAWRTAGAPGSMAQAAWVVGEGIIVLRPDGSMWRFRRDDGTPARAPIDVADHMSLPLAARVIDRRLALASPRGVAVIDADGILVGADALGEATRIEVPEICQGHMVAVEVNMRPLSDDESEAENLLRLFVFDLPTGKLASATQLRVYDTPRVLGVMDGKIIIPTGPGTLVVDIPPR